MKNTIKYTSIQNEDIIIQNENITKKFTYEGQKANTMPSIKITSEEELNCPRKKAMRVICYLLLGLVTK